MNRLAEILKEKITKRYKLVKNDIIYTDQYSEVYKQFTLVLGKDFKIKSFNHHQEIKKEKNPEYGAMIESISLGIPLPPVIKEDSEMYISLEDCVTAWLVFLYNHTENKSDVALIYLNSMMINHKKKVVLDNLISIAGLGTDPILWNALVLRNELYYSSLIYAIEVYADIYNNINDRLANTVRNNIAKILSDASIKRYNMYSIEKALVVSRILTEDDSLIKAYLLENAKLRIMGIDAELLPEDKTEEQAIEDELKYSLKMNIGSLQKELDKFDIDIKYLEEEVYNDYYAQCNNDNE